MNLVLGDYILIIFVVIVALCLILHCYDKISLEKRIKRKPLDKARLSKHKENNSEVHIVAQHVYGLANFDKDCIAKIKLLPSELNISSTNRSASLTYAKMIMSIPVYMKASNIFKLLTL